LDLKCSQLEQLLAGIASECTKQEDQRRGGREKLSAKAKDLIIERRRLRTEGTVANGRTVKQVSKDLQKELRAWRRLQSRQQIAEILEDFRGLRKIANINNHGRKAMLTSVRDETGDIRYDRQDIVDVLAKFYETLYARKVVGGSWTFTGNHEYGIPEVTVKEVSKQLHMMKNGKAADSNGIVAEMLKMGGEKLQAIITDLFNEILVRKAEPPEEWKRTRIKVLFKKGDPQLPSNYRPISILPILYKLFSRILHQRLRKYLDPEQCVDQAVFRAGFSCEDH
jgi:hypothetical protein